MKHTESVELVTLQAGKRQWLSEGCTSLSWLFALGVSGVDDSGGWENEGIDNKN